MTKSIAIHKLKDYSQAEIAVLQSRTEDDLSPYMDAVAPVIEEVRETGDAALVRYAGLFDKADLTGKSLVAYPFNTSVHRLGHKPSPGRATRMFSGDKRSPA